MSRRAVWKPISSVQIWKGKKSLANLLPPCCFEAPLEYSCENPPTHPPSALYKSTKNRYTEYRGHTCSVCDDETERERQMRENFPESEQMQCEKMEPWPCCCGLVIQ